MKTLLCPEACSFMSFLSPKVFFILISSKMSEDFSHYLLPFFDPIKLLAAMISRDSRQGSEVNYALYLKSTSFFPFSLCAFLNNAKIETE